MATPSCGLLREIREEQQEILDAQREMLPLVRSMASDFAGIKGGLTVFNGEVMVDNKTVCAYLNICERTLRRYRELYGLRVQRVARKCLYVAAEVREFKERLAKMGEYYG